MADVKVVNKQTGLSWSVPESKAKKLISSGDYESAHRQAKSKQSSTSKK